MSFLPLVCDMLEQLGVRCNKVWFLLFSTHRGFSSHCKESKHLKQSTEPHWNMELGWNTPCMLT